MDRYTRKDAENALGILVRHIGGHVADNWNDVGGYRLDYYQGYNVERIVNASGGITHPFGARRMTAREFVQTVRFATDAVYEAVAQNKIAAASA